MSELTNQPILPKAVSFRDDPQNASVFYEALGRAIVCWSRFEYTFDRCMDYLHKMPEAKAKRANSVSGNLDFWKFAFTEFQSLEKLRQLALNIAPDIEVVLSNRNHLLHGTFYQFTSLDPLTARLLRRQRTGTKTSRRHFEISVTDLCRFARDAEQLHARLLPFHFALTARR